MSLIARLLALFQPRESAADRQLRAHLESQLHERWHVRGGNIGTRQIALEYLREQLAAGVPGQIALDRAKARLDAMVWPSLPPVTRREPITAGRLALRIAEQYDNG